VLFQLPNIHATFLQRKYYDTDLLHVMKIFFDNKHTAIVARKRIIIMWQHRHYYLTPIAQNFTFAKSKFNFSA